MAEIMEVVPTCLKCGNHCIKRNGAVGGGIGLPFVFCPMTLTHLSPGPFLDI